MKHIKILFIILLCIIVTGCTNNTSKESSSTVSLKYNGNEVDEIVINSSNTTFNVVGSAVGENLTYKIVFISTLGAVNNKVVLEEIDSTENVISSKEININAVENVIYEGNIISGEVAYGKIFKLVFNSFDIMDTANSYKIKIMK